MALPSDWYIDKGEAGQSISQQHQFTQDTAKLMIELMRLLRKQPSVLASGELLEPLAKHALEPLQLPSEIIDAQVLYENPELPTAEIPLIEPEIIPDLPALPSFQHRPDQIVADTAQMLVDQLGDRGTYQAEGYTIQREERPVTISVSDGNANLQADQIIYRLWDKDQNEILAFRDAGPDRGYDILKDEMLPEDFSAMLKARLGIEQAQGIEAIMADPTFAKQLKALGQLAPAGSQAAHFAHYALDGYKANTLTTPQYQISRDEQGNVSIHKNPSIGQKFANRVIAKPAHTPGTSGAPATAETIHHPSGQVLLQTEGGRIEVFSMESRDRQNFDQLFSAAQEKPLNQIIAPPTKSAKPQISRDS